MARKRSTASLANSTRSGQGRAGGRQSATTLCGFCWSLIVPASSHVFDGVNGGHCPQTLLSAMHCILCWFPRILCFTVVLICCLLLAGPSGAGAKPAAAGGGAGAPGSAGKVEAVIVLDDSSEDEGPKRPARGARAAPAGREGASCRDV
jgi:hypothetical protein